VLVCLTGADLPLGQAITRRLQSQGISVFEVSNALLTEDDSVLSKHLESTKPADYIIHAGELGWHEAENHPRQAELVSLECCPSIINFAGLWHAPIIFLSSFMVFDGAKKNPYISANSGQPLNAYGQIKLATENYILENYSSALVLRLGWLLDEGQHGWLGVLLQKILAGEVVKAYSDIELSPTAADDVARVIDAILKQLDCGINVWGLYHYAGTEPVSHEALIRAIQYQVLGQHLDESQIETLLFDSSDYELKLPKNGVLGCIKLRNTFGIKQLPWRRYLPVAIQKQRLLNP